MLKWRNFLDLFSRKVQQHYFCLLFLPVIWMTGSNSGFLPKPLVAEVLIELSLLIGTDATTPFIQAHQMSFSATLAGMMAPYVDYYEHEIKSRYSRATPYHLMVGGDELPITYTQMYTHLFQNHGGRWNLRLEPHPRLNKAPFSSVSVWLQVWSAETQAVGSMERLEDTWVRHGWAGECWAGLRVPRSSFKALRQLHSARVELLQDVKDPGDEESLQSFLSSSTACFCLQTLQMLPDMFFPFKMCHIGKLMVGRWISFWDVIFLGRELLCSLSARSTQALWPKGVARSLSGVHVQQHAGIHCQTTRVQWKLQNAFLGDP